MTDQYALTRVWLARSLAAAAPALRDLADDPAINRTPEPAAGFTPPVPPTRTELHDAASVIERVANCLRHADGKGAP